MSISEINHAKTTLHEIALHAHTLGMGLQNAAPPEVKTGVSIQYLKDISAELENISKQIDDLISNRH